MRITVLVPDDEPVTDVNLPTNDNIDRFKVIVEKPNGEDVPVKDGEVNMIVDYEMPVN